MKRKLLSILIYLSLMVSMGIIIIGLSKLQKIQNNLDHGVIEFEKKINKDIQKPATPTTPDTISEGAIGLLIVNDNYKIAIYEGVSEKSMLDGIGHLNYSASLNTIGNSILYGHRDSAFRFLKDISEKDQIIIQTVNSKKVYTVRSMKVVDPNDPSIFAPSEQTKLSFVTCYPFSFYGPALQRYLVEAVLEE